MQIIAALVFALVACGSSSQPRPTTPPTTPTTPTTPTPPTKPPASIGSATMQDDGTIVLQLRAEGEHGEIGDAQLFYPPSHAQYDSVLKHLGGLKPGETKPVAPWQ